MIVLLKSFEIYLSYNNDNNYNDEIINNDMTKYSYNFVNLMKESNLVQSSMNENSDINVNYYKLAPLNVDYYLLNGNIYIYIYIYNILFNYRSLPFKSNFYFIIFFSLFFFYP